MGTMLCTTSGGGGRRASPTAGARTRRERPTTDGRRGADAGGQLDESDEPVPTEFDETVKELRRLVSDTRAPEVPSRRRERDDRSS